MQDEVCSLGWMHGGRNWTCSGRAVTVAALPWLCCRRACSHTGHWALHSHSFPQPVAFLVLHVPQLPLVHCGAVSEAGTLMVSEPSAIAFSTYRFVIHLCQWIIWRAGSHVHVNWSWSWSGDMSCLRLQSSLTKWYKVHLALSVCKACDRESKPCI